MPKGSHEEVVVDSLPTCDLCQDGTPAYADAQIPGGTAWGYVCERHFKEYRCKLGLGRGQKLVVRK